MISGLERQKAADAAFFEDWSEWENLDGNPIPDRLFGHFYQQPAQHNRYWCMLRVKSLIVGGPVFELALPESATVLAVLKPIHGVRRMPARFLGSPGNHRVPAEHWQQLRAALPIIKRLIIERQKLYHQ